VVDRAQLLVALPGDGDLVVGVAGVQAGVEAGDLAVGEVLDTVAQQPSDLVQGVVLVPAAPDGGLLDAAADLVDDGGAEPDDVEGVQDRDGVGQLVADRVGLAVERVQRRLLDAGDELGRPPAARRRSRPRTGRGRRRAARAYRQPCSSRVRSTIDVTARSVPSRDGRQMCSSTPRVATPSSRAGSSRRAVASTSTASHKVCQSTPRWRASAETVVSSWPNASVGQDTARAVSFALGATIGWVSENVSCGQSGSTQRQIRLRHTTTVGTEKHGASCTRCSRRPCPVATTPQVGSRRRRPRTRRSAPAARVRGPRPQQVHPGDVEQRIGSGAPANARTTPTVVVHVGVFLRSAASSLLILKAPTPPSRLCHADPGQPPTHAQLGRAPKNRKTQDVSVTRH